MPELIKIKYYNCPEFNPKDVAITKAPSFVDYKPNFALIKHLSEKYASFEKLVIIGHGGSVSTFFGIYNLWQTKSTKKVYFLSTVDPEYIIQVKNETNPKDTLVISISKSGETVTQLEIFLQFLEYQSILITDQNSPLAQIGKEYKSEIVPHPEIGGRYTGFTEVALLPSALCGFSIEKIFEGASLLYKNFSEPNEALTLSKVLFELENSGYVDIYLPIYHHGLFNFGYLITQLCHESFGKSGLGQSYLCYESPEAQHHTNQRFFGGRKNIAGLFLSAGYSNDLATNVTDSLSNISLKDGSLKDINDLNLSTLMQIEKQAVIEHAVSAKIPVVDMHLESTSEELIGNFIAFFQLFAVYSSILRNVDPYNQPEVELSKKISWEKRKNYKNR